MDYKCNLKINLGIFKIKYKQIVALAKKDFSNSHFFEEYKYKLSLKFNKLFSTKNFWLWSIFAINTRLGYKFNALYNGISVNRQSQANLFNFRRNIHRLEKGLSYQTIKSVFAEDYILETVNYFQEGIQHHIFDENTKIWGAAILDLYFSTCLHTEIISKANKLYQTIEVDNKCKDKDWTPYRTDSRPELSVDYETLYKLALRRRSIRDYLLQKVESNEIVKAMKLAALSPSACNRQSFKFLFFDEPNLVKKISAIPGGVSGYTIPSVVVVVGDYKGYFDERDINAPTIDSSLSVMSFLFALETLGLSSVCINWPNLVDREKKIRQLINLEKEEFIVMLIGVGYPAAEGKIPYSAKRNVEEILLINQRIKQPESLK